MDAKAHLQKLGWRGSGYSLDRANRGLAKPLLISHKFDSHGLGSKKQKEKLADQWWLNAFDSALKDLGSGKSVSFDLI
jgi:nucleolar protein TMA23